jgi:hypothetical protein
MVHLLPVELVMDVAARVEQRGGEHDVLRLGFLQAEDVGLLLVEQPPDEVGAGAHRIDVPRGDLELGHGGLSGGARLYRPRKRGAF